MHGTTRHDALTSDRCAAHAPLLPSHALPTRPEQARFATWLLRTLLLSCCLTAQPVTAQLEPQLVVDRLGPVAIELANNYSENTRLRIRVVYPSGHSRAGEVMSGFQGALVIEEWRTRIYDGEYGATRLPMTVGVNGGEAEVVLKSLARYTVYDSRNAPIPQVAIFLDKKHVLVDVPQWVDEDGNDKTDWLEARVENILRRARASGAREVVEVTSVLGGWKESYKRDCGGYVESDPRSATISSVCIDWDGVNVHRLNMRQELAATVLHEIRHVWAHYRPDRTLYKLRLLNAPSGQREAPGCNLQRMGNDMCSVHIRDERYAAQEADAEAFANKYKDLFP